MSTRPIRALILALAVLVALPSIASAAWPVTVRSSYVSQWYSSGHRGIDIAAPRWTGVVPIGNGKVVFAGWKSNCGGYQVWVRHRDGVTYSAYYHLARETTSAGAYVTGETERIGQVGIERLRHRQPPPPRGLEGRPVAVGFVPGQPVELRQAGLLAAISLPLRALTAAARCR